MEARAYNQNCKIIDWPGYQAKNEYFGALKDEGHFT
jgi:hypothetical protein